MLRICSGETLTALNLCTNTWFLCTHSTWDWHQTRQSHGVLPPAPQSIALLIAFVLVTHLATFLFSIHVDEAKLFPALLLLPPKRWLRAWVESVYKNTGTEGTASYPRSLANRVNHKQQDSFQISKCTCPSLREGSYASLFTKCTYFEGLELEELAECVSKSWLRTEGGWLKQRWTWCEKHLGYTSKGIKIHGDSRATEGS